MKHKLPAWNEIGARMDALGDWTPIAHCNWAIKPIGSAIPYFCSVLTCDDSKIKVRVMLLEGWQTFHDFVAFVANNDYGFIQNVMEFPQYDMTVMRDGSLLLFRHDTGYAPRLANERESELCGKMLWQMYGMMMRLESDEKLPLAFADKQALFARIEKKPGEWVDEPIAIVPGQPFVEKVSILKKQMQDAKDCPLIADEAIELDMLICPEYKTAEARPRTLYVFAAVDAKTGKVLFRDKLAVGAEDGLRGLWQGLPPRLLAHFIGIHRVPGEIRMRSGRLFRILRPLGLELPIKLVKCTELKCFANALKDVI